MTNKKLPSDVSFDSVDSYVDFLAKKTIEINNISPTFCAAKWLQSTILLYNGETHSCHHPSRHKITIEDIESNKRGIHNTKVKMKAREDLLKGIQTKECGYCWKIENMEKNFVSDRIYKSTYSWSLPYFDKILESGNGENIDPTYLEVAFESTCNFKCVYCSPESSSRWQEEAEVHGPIPLTTFKMHDVEWLREAGKLPIHRNDYNPYVEAFWDWWPDLYPTLHTFRITGGEPLLSKHTWAVLDYIKEHPLENQNLVLAINTNLDVPDKLVDKLIEYINAISPNIKQFDVYTSIENVGEQAEYTRYGMVYAEFIDNCHKILQQTSDKTFLNIMTTINVLSAPTFLDFLHLLKEFRIKYQITQHAFKLRTMLSYLRWPACMQLTLLSDDDKKKYAEEWRTFVTENLLTPEHKPNESFYHEELDQINRLIEFMFSESPNNAAIDFKIFIHELDKRRGTTFTEIFPTLSYLVK